MTGKHAGARSSRQGEGADLDPDAVDDRRRSRLRAVAGLLALLVVATGIVALTALWDDPAGAPDPGAATGTTSEPSGASSPTGPPACPTTDDLDGPVTVAVDPALAPTLRAVVRDSGCTGVELTARPSSEVAAAALADEDLPDVWVPESTLWVVRARPADSTGDATDTTDTADTAIAPEVVADSLAISPVVVASSSDATRNDATWRSLISDPGLKIGSPLTGTAALAPLLGARVEADDAGVRPSPQAADLAPLAGRAGSRTGPPAGDRARLRAAARSGGVAAVAEQTVLSSRLSPDDVTLSIPEVGTLVLDYPAVATATGDRRAAAYSVAAWLGLTTATADGTATLADVGFRGPDGLPLEEGVTGARAMRLRDLGVLSQTLTAWSSALQAAGVPS